MTVREKKKWLMRYQVLKKEIERNLEEQAQLLAFCTRVTPVLSSTPAGSSGKRKDDNWARLADLNIKIEKKVSLYAQMHDEIDEAISMIEDEEQQLVLRYRYMNGYTWTKTARKMHVSERTAQRIHERALGYLYIR